jgi:hypothetical protein
MAMNEAFAKAAGTYTRGPDYEVPQSLAAYKLSNISDKLTEKNRVLDPVASAEEEQNAENRRVADMFSAGGLAASSGENLWDVAQASALGT